MGAEDSNASLIQRPMLAINKCFGQHCKTDEETKQFLKNKFLQLTILSKSYNTTNYNPEEKIQRIATRYNIRLDIDQYKDIVIKSRTESLETEDEFYSLGLISDEKTFYTIP